MNKSAEAGAAKEEIESGLISYGYMTSTIVIKSSNIETVERYAVEIERIINGFGFSTIREGINAPEAWLGSIPGLARQNIRKPLISTLNLARIMPTSATWQGTTINKHLNDVALFRAVTEGSTPFDYSTHVGDLGHTLIIGPTSSGKSTFLAFMALQFPRYKNAKVIFFDKGNSIKAATLGVKGRFIDAADSTKHAFQPLREIHDAREISFAQDWIIMLLEGEGLVVTSGMKTSIWTALGQLAETTKDLRTISNFSLMVQDQEIKSTLEPYCKGGAYGHILDAVAEELNLVNFQAFEMEEILKMGSVVSPLLAYLFHMIEKQLNPANPTMIILDEAWVFLDNPYFEEKIKEWLKVLRKKNAFVIFATQNLADFKNSSIGDVVAGNVLTKIFLPNPDAIMPSAYGFYSDMGLNDPQINLIANSIMKRQYYVTSPMGTRLFELGLSEFALAFCGAPAGDKTQEIISELEDSDNFAIDYLKAVGMDWAAELFNQGEQDHENK